MRLLAYVRVSRVAGREGDSFISPAVQRERIAAYAAAQGHVIIDVLEELDQPGSKYQRPLFQEALARIEAGEADGIAVAALDRFARSVPDAATALRRLEDAGAVLVSVRDALDTSTPVGRFARTMMLAIAELELERVRENWATARDRAIARGVHITPRVPVGYERGNDGRLTPDPNAGPVIRAMFERRAAGESWSDLCDYLADALPRPEGRRWPIQSVNRIIGNRCYLGEARAGDIVNPDAHEPIVSRALWEAAQSAPKLVRSRREEPALLAGLLRCGTCGETMTRSGSGRRGYSNYQCRSRHSSVTCNAPAKVSTLRADAHVEAAFLAWLDAEPIAVAGHAPETDIATLVELCETAEAELAAYRDANLITVIGKDAYIAGLEERVRAINDARAALAERQTADALAGVPRAELATVWPELATGERRQILAAGLRHVVCQRAPTTGKGTPAVERLQLVWK